MTRVCMATPISQLSWLDGCRTNNVTELAVCHSCLFTWAWQHAHTLVFIKRNPPDLYVLMRVSETKTKNNVPVPPACLSACLVCPARCCWSSEWRDCATCASVWLDGRLRCFHFQQASLLSDVPLRTSYLKLSNQTAGFASSYSHAGVERVLAVCD